MEESFEYTYSAPEQSEVQRIRSKYMPKKEAETTLEKVKRLDREADRPGIITALLLGIVGTLTFGSGMSVWLVWKNPALGICLGLPGIILAAIAYPVYRSITCRRRKKIAPEILKLTEQLM